MDWLSWSLLYWPGWLLAVLLVIAGLAGAVLPVVPGVPLVLGGLLMMAALDGFVHVSWATMLWLTFLTILSVVVDFLAIAEGARRFGAGRLAILGATLGLLVGIFFGLPGILFGPFVGAFAGHLAARANIDDSIRAGVGASIGILVGTLAKLAIGLLMIVWFVVAWILYRALITRPGYVRSQALQKHPCFNRRYFSKRSEKILSSLSPNSTAPMSAAAPTTRGKPMPRWSCV